METNEEIDIQLWEYMDGTCSVADMQRISILVERDALWKQKYDELSAFQASLSGNLELEHPPMRFTKNVMDAVAAAHIAPATRKYINLGIIRSIAALFIIMLTVIIGYAVANTHANTSGPSLLSQFSISKVNFGKLFNSTTMNIILSANVIIGLAFMDMVFRKKRTQQHD